MLLGNIFRISFSKNFNYCSVWSYFLCSKFKHFHTYSSFSYVYCFENKWPISYYSTKTMEVQVDQLSTRKEIVILNNDTVFPEERCDSPPVKLLVLNADTLSVHHPTNALENAEDFQVDLANLEVNCTNSKTSSLTNLSDLKKILSVEHDSLQGDSQTSPAESNDENLKSGTSMVSDSVVKISVKDNEDTSEHVVELPQVAASVCLNCTVGQNDLETTTEPSVVDELTSKHNGNCTSLPTLFPTSAEYDDVCEPNKNKLENNTENVSEKEKHQCSIADNKETDSLNEKVKDASDKSESDLIPGRLKAGCSKDLETDQVLLEELPFLDSMPSDECLDHKDVNEGDREDLKYNSWISELPFSECSVLDDSVTVETVTKKEEKKQKAKKKKKDKGEKMQRIPPNYFIGIQVTDPQVKSQFTAIQEAILKKEPLLKPAMIDVESLHLTLAVFHVAQPQDLLRCLAALDASYKVINEKEYMKDCILNFEGIGHFRNQVVFAEVKSGPELEHMKEMAEIVQASLEEQGFPREKKQDEFTPHLTILKLSKAPKLRFKKIKTVPAQYYAEYLQTTLGKQRVNGLQLLSMQRPKEAKGYYKCIKEIMFSSQETSS